MWILIIAFFFPFSNLVHVILALRCIQLWKEENVSINWILNVPENNSEHPSQCSVHSWDVRAVTVWDVHMKLHRNKQPQLSAGVREKSWGVLDLFRLMRHVLIWEAVKSARQDTLVTPQPVQMFKTMLTVFRLMLRWFQSSFHVNTFLTLQTLYNWHNVQFFPFPEFFNHSIIHMPTALKCQTLL